MSDPREYGANDNDKRKMKLQRDYFEPNKMIFTDGSMPSKNKEKEVNIDTMASDDTTFTGKEEGFFAKFGSKEVNK